MKNFNIPAMQDATIAIQKEGRMTKGSIDWLNENAGTDFPVGPAPFSNIPTRRLTDSATGITIVGRSNGDNLKEVATGRPDLAIAGTDKLGEVMSDEFNPFGFKVISPLGFATCRLMFARKIGDDNNDLPVATSYPRQTRRFLGEQGINAPVSYYGGGVEMIARDNGYNVVDIVETGSSLAANGFEPIGAVADTEAALIGVEDPATHDPEVYDLLSRGGSIGDLLSRRLTKRRESPTASLASRVINDTTGNLGIKKIGEESAEVVAALISGDRQATITEIADLTFWLAANGVRIDVTNTNVERELLRRYIEGS